MIFPFLARQRRLLPCRLGVLCVALAGWLFLASARAQKQESGLLDRIQHPNMTLKFDAADKQFGSSAAASRKQAQVKSFSFGRQSAAYGGGDGVFRSKTFNNSKQGFQTNSYGVKTSQLSQRNSFAQADKGFDTKGVDVREASAANKSAGVRDYVPAQQAFYGRGKRQDTMDEMTKGNKNLTIEQVRDLLNKGPAGRP